MSTTHPRIPRSMGQGFRLVIAGAALAALALTGTGHAVAQPADTAPQSPATTTCQSFWPTPYQVCGEILDLYTSLGGPNSTLSFPSGTETPAGDGIGTRQAFFGGAVYYSPATGAYIE